MTKGIDSTSAGGGMPGTGLVRPLFEGPIDVIGDVHGELAALTDLIAALGYDADGVHPDGRRLVFVGDLCDRGPDSPGVLRWVQRLVEAGGHKRSRGTTSSTCYGGNKSTGTTGSSVTLIITISAPA